MGRRFAISVVLFLLPLSVPAETSTQQMYIRVASTGLRVDKTGTSKVKAKLNLGAAVTVVSTSGRWSYVKTEKGDGFVFSAKLTHDPPAADDDPLWGMLADDASAGVGQREVSTAQAIRGLSPAAKAYASRTEVSEGDVKAVRWMERQTIPDDELQAFLKSGKLAEYAR